MAAGVPLRLTRVEACQGSLLVSETARGSAVVVEAVG